VGYNNSMNTTVKVILAIVAALILLGFLKNLLFSFVFYALLAAGAVAILALIARWLIGRGSTVQTSRKQPNTRTTERQAERELKQLEKRVGHEYQTSDEQQTLRSQRR
jgi:ABC-type nickel/cobalt efflux system permease component RcnA